MWRERAKLVAYFGLAIVFIGLAIWWEMYKFADCKAVGHETLYCVGKLMEG